MIPSLILHLYCTDVVDITLFRNAWADGVVWVPVLPCGGGCAVVTVAAEGWLTVAAVLCESPISPH